MAAPGPTGPKGEITKPIEELMKLYTEKLSKSILPPDPLRIIKGLLRIPPGIEHILPIPPVLEKVHAEITEPTIEALPRLPLTGDFYVTKFKEWVVP